MVGLFWSSDIFLSICRSSNINQRISYHNKLEYYKYIMVRLLKLIVFVYGLIALTLQAANKKIKPGTLIELECPAAALKQITNMRTYALVLNNAQKNMEIRVFINKLEGIKKYEPTASDNTSQIQIPHPIKGIDRYPLSLECVLNKDQKVCVLDGFINQISINCSSTGSISLLIVEPVLIYPNNQDQVIKERVIAPILGENEKGILIFRPNINIDLTQSSLEDIFISNCVESIDFFQHEFLLGIKGSGKIDIILTTDGILGEWVFTRVSNVVSESQHVTQAYNMPKQLTEFHIQQQEQRLDKVRSYGFKLLICSENRAQMENLSINITAVLKIQNELFSQEEINQTILIKPGDLGGKMPIKIAFFYEEHPLQKIFFDFSQAVHYKLQLSQSRSEGQKQNYLPVVEEDEYLYYSYENKETSLIKIEAHIVKSYQTKLTPTLKVITEGVKGLTGRVKYLEQNQTNGTISELISIVDGKIQPVKINNNNSYAEILLEIQIPQNKKQVNSLMSIFKIMLETSFSLIQIEVGQIKSEFLFENQVKRFIIVKQKMDLISSKKLKVVCTSCHAFLTYNANCTSINCCEYAHADQVQVKSANLMIIVASSIHMTDTVVIKLQLYQDQKAFTLQNGQIVEGLLQSFDNYIFESDGKQQIQIIFNSQVQSILMLAMVTKNEFPTKTSFDYQSNQGYIRIAPLKIKKTIYITLLKTIASFQFSLSNYKIPYSVVVLTEKGYLNIKEGNQFSHILARNAKKQYLLEHPCDSSEKLYFKVYPKSHTSLVGVNHDFSSPTLNVKIREKSQLYFVAEKNLSQHGTFEVTKYLETKPKSDSSRSGENNNQICSIIVSIKNLLAETLSLTLMFFKEKQIYQIYAGQFSRNQLLARNKLSLFCVVNPERQTNIYAYSLLEEIVMKVKIISVRELKLMELYSQISSARYNEEIQTNFLNQRFTILKEFQQKMASHSQYMHLAPIKYYKQGAVRKEQDLIVVVIQINKNQYNNGFQRNDIYAICTQNQTVIRVGNRLHYQIMNGQSHTFLYPLSGEMILGDTQKSRQSFSTRNTINNDKQIILQTTKLNGNYIASARIKYFGKQISNLNFLNKKDTNPTPTSKKSPNKQHQQQPIVIIKTELIRTALNQYVKASNHKEIQLMEFNNLYLEFQIACTKSQLTDKYCIFLTTLQTSQSDIRELTLGVPEIFHINKHSSIIFIYNNNLHDSQFKFKVNRKLGFPNYKLCSYRPALNRAQQVKSQESNLQQQSSTFILSDLQAQDKCLSDLQNPQNELNLRIQQNAFNTDSKLIVGRTHELIINQYNQQYCTNCTYYLGLYSDYDIVEGSIFVMSANQETLLEEGNSITTIVYRGEPDRYALVNWQSLMGIVYEIEGHVKIKVYYFDIKTKNKVVVLQKSTTNEANKMQSTPTAQSGVASNSNIITINLQIQNNSSETHEYFAQIEPANNLPSALYTLVIMNKEEQVINIKDGVPYEMKYAPNTDQNGKKAFELHPIIHYRYVCENQGTIMLSTKNFDDLELQLTCRDHFNEEESKNLVNDRIGKPIDIKELLKAKKLYKMSNRFDIMVNPKICSKYQLTITTKTPSISYKVLVSSTDIVTLPMNKQVPGILKYQSKLYQIYEISVNEKTQVRCTFKFCQGGDGRIMIAKSKKNIYEEIYQSQLQINEDTTFETMKYTAKPGLFYIKLQFKASGGVMEYTLYVQKLANAESKEGKQNTRGDVASPLKIYKNLNSISYKVLRIGYDFTDYEINFYPIMEKSGIFQIDYYIVESTKLTLLKKTQNCNGQYFEELVNHHNQIKETKIAVPKPAQPLEESENNTIRKFDVSVQKEYKVEFKYSTSLSYSFITIIPIVYNKQTHQFYHMHIPKYHEVQLTNGQIFSKVSYILSEIASKVEQVIDIHASEYAILVILAIFFVLCILTTLIGGIWIGAKYFFKTKTVYVLKEIKQEDIEQEIENQDNAIQDYYANNSAVALVPEILQNRQQIQQINPNQNIADSQTNQSNENPVTKSDTDIQEDGTGQTRKEEGQKDEQKDRGNGNFNQQKM